MQYIGQISRRFGWPLIALWLVATILLLDAMAACPALHEFIHQDAGKPDHDCAVTMFAQGKTATATCDVPIPPPPIWFETTLSINFFSFSASIDDPHPGRDPPLPCVAS